MERTKEDIFQDSVSIGYGSNRVWTCECSRTECYAITMSEYLEGDHNPFYVIRDWKLGRDWRYGHDRQDLACLNPDCYHFCSKHKGIEQEYPTAIIERKIETGQIGTMPFKASEADLCTN